MAPATMLLVGAEMGVAVVSGGSDSQSTAKDAAGSERIVVGVKIEQT